MNYKDYTIAELKKKINDIMVHICECRKRIWQNENEIWGLYFRVDEYIVLIMKWQKENKQRREREKERQRLIHKNMPVQNNSKDIK